MDTAILYALSANLSFAFGSIFFTHYSRKFSSLWVNTYKALIAAACFALAVLIADGFHSISFLNFIIFFISGFIALGIGDIFLIQGFKLIGPGRTLLLFGFQPVLIGVLSLILFSQTINTNKFIGIIFFVLCLLTFSFETFKHSGKWDVRGLVFACLGMIIDGIGVIITRYAFDMNKAITGFEGNFYRCLGAVIAYILISRFRPFHFRKHLHSLSKRGIIYVTIGALFGTFLSLAFYLEAIKIGHLASLSAIAITSVIFSALFEHIWERKWPNRYLVLAFIFFACGMKFIL